LRQGNGGFQQTKPRGIGGKQNQAKGKGGKKKDINDENLGNPKAKAKGGNASKDIGDDAHQAGTKAGVENEDIGQGCTAAGVMAELDKIQHNVGRDDR
jgi:hypothetical protein